MKKSTRIIIAYLALGIIAAAVLPVVFFRTAIRIPEANSFLTSVTDTVQLRPFSFLKFSIDTPNQPILVLDLEVVASDSITAPSMSFAGQWNRRASFDYEADTLSVSLPDLFELIDRKGNEGKYIKGNIHLNTRLTVPRHMLAGVASENFFANLQVLGIDADSFSLKGIYHIDFMDCDIRNMTVDMQDNVTGNPLRLTDSTIGNLAIAFSEFRTLYVVCDDNSSIGNIDITATGESNSLDLTKGTADHVNFKSLTDSGEVKVFYGPKNGRKPLPTE